MQGKLRAHMLRGALRIWHALDVVKPAKREKGRDGVWVEVEPEQRRKGKWDWLREELRIVLVALATTRDVCQGLGGQRRRHMVLYNRAL